MTNGFKQWVMLINIIPLFFLPSSAQANGSAAAAEKVASEFYEAYLKASESGLPSQESMKKLSRFCKVCCSSTNANERARLNVAEYAVQETRDILSRELFGHYDITELEVLKINDRAVLDVRDYGLAKVTLRFSAKRNAKSTLNPSLFEPGGCLASLYLHCGVPAGHVFAGKLEVLLAVDRDGLWRAVDPNWRSRRQYPLSDYLLLEGRKKEGYVVPPK